MIWVIRNYCIFETVADTNVKLENSKKKLIKLSLATLINYNLTVASGAPITIEVKWRLRWERMLLLVLRDDIGEKSSATPQEDVW
jgi:hypothetical protein